MGSDSGWGGIVHVIGRGSRVSGPPTRTDGNGVVVAVGLRVQDTANQVGQDITKRNMSIQPTLTIQTGFPMRVMVSRDLVLRLYQPLIFQRGTSQ